MQLSQSDLEKYGLTAPLDPSTCEAGQRVRYFYMQTKWDSDTKQMKELGWIENGGIILDPKKHDLAELGGLIYIRQRSNRIIFSSLDYFTLNGCGCMSPIYPA